MMRYTDSLDGIGVEQLRGGFWVDWPDHPSPERHLDILRGSYAVWLAIDDETGEVVGFVNAISDGVLAAYIPLLEVLPDYQGRGIGHELMRRMLASLGHLYMVDLACDEHLQPFYERFGMRRAMAMIARNYDRQRAGS
jgi:ribosomal protein S18 acetylase RimI-like enzyme